MHGFFEETGYKPIESGGVGAELINFFLRENAKQSENGKYVGSVAAITFPV